MRRAFAPLAILLLAPDVAAQGARAGVDSARPLVFGVPAGAQLRVRLGESRLGGILVSASRDTLVLRDTAYFPLRLPIAALTEVEVLRTRRWVRKRMVIGAVTGAAAVALVVGVVHSRLADCDAPCGRDKDPPYAIAAFSGGAIGLLAGAARSQQRWERVWP